MISYKNSKTFHFPLEPVPWSRARLCGTVHFKAPKLRLYQNQLAMIARSVWKGMPTEEPLAIDLFFNLVRPKTVDRPYPSVKPDVDNLIKAVLDALNKVIWKDDCQICVLNVSKTYANDGKPSITAVVHQLE